MVYNRKPENKIYPNKVTRHLSAESNFKIIIMWGMCLHQRFDVRIFFDWHQGLTSGIWSKDEGCSMNRCKVESFLPGKKIDFGDCNGIAWHKRIAET